MLEEYLPFTYPFSSPNKKERSKQYNKNTPKARGLQITLSIAPHSVTVDTNNRLGLQVNTSVIKTAFHGLKLVFTRPQDGTELNLSCGFISLGWLLQSWARILFGGVKSCPIMCWRWAMTGVGMEHADHWEILSPHPPRAHPTVHIFKK